MTAERHGFAVAQGTKVAVRAPTLEPHEVLGRKHSNRRGTKEKLFGFGLDWIQFLDHLYSDAWVWLTWIRRGGGK